jgi:hypothetical protein
MHLLRATAVVPILLLLACDGAKASREQPVAFSHRVHVAVNGIGCTMCHAYAEHSPVAGMPAMARCNGCHKFVANDKPVIQALNAAFEEHRPTEWVRVYDLPDHVFFTHERHLAAHLSCSDCHGDVARMDVVRQAQPLTMGFCLGCHDGERAPRDCLTCHK